MASTIPDFNSWSSRIAQDDFQRTNLYFVRLPVGLVLSAALAGSMNSLVGSSGVGSVAGLLPSSPGLVSSTASAGNSMISQAIGPAGRSLLAKLNAENSPDALVSSVGTPDLSVDMEQNPLDTFGGSIPISATEGQIPVTLMCTTSAPQYLALWEWYNTIQNAETGRMGFYNDYAKGHKLEIEFLDRKLNITTSYEFFDVTPVNVSPVQMSWESNDEIMKVDVDFKFRKHRFSGAL